MSIIAATLTATLLAAPGFDDEEAKWVRYEPTGEAKDVHVVLLSGDEEYRSEEALPMLGKILAVHHGFTCTVLFSIDPETGAIDPDNRKNVPGIEMLADADLLIIATRFRDYPDESMKYVDDYVRAGKPIIGMRTATHAFNLSEDSSYRRYTFNYGDESYKQGFGRQILGETWINHHGGHGSESTRGIIAPGSESHPIARGIEPKTIWGPTDVYGVRLPLPGDSTPIVLGAVLDGMDIDDEPVEGKKNDPMMPVSWTKTYKGDDGTVGRVFTTTMGAATDLTAEGSRRMMVNAVYWAVGLEDDIPEGGTNVDVVGEFDPTDFGFGRFVKGVMPAEHALEK